ncbi:MAG: phosphoribosyltransferase [Candidatus Brocadiales bacterium]
MNGTDFSGVAMIRFKDHTDAGEKLAQELTKYKGRDVTVLAIPRGGVIVGRAVATRLGCELDIVAARKIPVPWAPEVGYGAVTHDGTVVFNEEFASRLALPKTIIDAQTEKVMREVKRRLAVYRGSDRYETLDGKVAIIVDDGIATGISMLASVEFVRKLNPDKVVVASPVASESGLLPISGKVDETVVLYVSYATSFAVAMFYEEWREFSDEEITECLSARTNKTVQLV